MKYKKRILLKIKVKNIQMHFNTSLFHDSLVIRIEYKKNFIHCFFLRTCLGPKAMLKMLMDPMGGIVMTNDGNAILREITVQHPAAKTMIEIARTQVTTLKMLILRDNNVDYWKFLSFKMTSLTPQSVISSLGFAAGIMFLTI